MRMTLTFMASLLVACGEDSPVEKCDHLVDITCDRAVECIPTGGTHAECVEEVRQQLPCGSAKSVTESYDRCVDQIDSVTCGTLFPNNMLDLPADCSGVIQLSRRLPDDGSSTPSQRTLQSFAVADEQ